MLFSSIRTSDRRGIRSPFRFPPLGLGYIASQLRNHGLSVKLVDCTFRSEDSAVQTVRDLHPSIIGIYSMFSMSTSALRLARLLRKDCDLLVAGGPLPSIFPEDYLKAFDVVCIGEGEETMLELAEAHLKQGKLTNIKGICIRTSLESNARTSRIFERLLALRFATLILSHSLQGIYLTTTTTWSTIGTVSTAKRLQLSQLEDAPLNVTSAAGQSSQTNSELDPLGMWSTSWSK